MGFRINTNVAAMNAQVNANLNNRELDSSLARLSSGLRINTAADDAAGLTIANTLRSQANSLGQAVRNANDAIGMVQTADKAMDGQLTILDTIKTKATQAAQDGQSLASRTAIQQDITKLLQELDNIAATTSFNGINLLSGSFTNKAFQIGAGSRETIGITIGDTSSAKIGQVRTETTGLSASGASGVFTNGGMGSVTLKFTNADGSTTTLNTVTISTNAGNGMGSLVEAIYRVADTTGVRASSRVEMTGSVAVAAGTINSLSINGISLGQVVMKDNDKDGVLVSTINAVTQQTGVVASVDASGKLSLTSVDGRTIQVRGTSGAGAGQSGPIGIGATGAGTMSSGGLGLIQIGKLTLTSLGARDIIVSNSGSSAFMRTTVGTSAITQNLRDVTGNFKTSVGNAIGAYANLAQSAAANQQGSYLGAGVTTRAGAMLVMDIAESAIKQLNAIRSGIGSAQNQLIATIDNISVTQLNLSAAESQIRDVDFAAESANFSKRNILAQSGSYAMSQASAIQQNVLRLLQ